MIVLVLILFLAIKSSGDQQILPLGYPCEIFRTLSTEFSNRLLPVQIGSCRPQLNCTLYQKARYRTIDGKCNNIRNDKSLWGSRGSEFVRIAKRTKLFRQKYPPSFFFVSKDRVLPNARDVSSKLHAGADGTFKNYTTMVMQVGQFIDHDLTLTEETNTCSENECPSKKEIDCCDFIDFQTFESDNAPSGCMPILIPENDEFYSQQHPKVRCLDFKISKTSPSCNARLDNTGTASRKEPFNSVTSYLDASVLYGSNDAMANRLRAFRDGLMKTNNELGSDYLPFEENICPEIKPTLFTTGDERVNENPGLQSQHTLWMREHNRIAVELGFLNRDWNDEKIFQEARRLVIAQWQNIVYKEFLPVVLGANFVKGDEKLNVDIDSDYHSEVNADILVAFSTAAFRFGHSLITDDVLLMKEGSLEGVLLLQNSFFNTSILRNRKLDALLEGMCNQNAHLVNSKIASSVRNFLFRKKGKNFGSDLASRNIQRGRDHELAPYNSYRKLCGLSQLPPDFYHAPPKEFDEETWHIFSQLYAEPEDIELFPGGMAEKHADGGAIVGPTFRCLIAEQFRRLRSGDRYFFTHKNVDGSIGFCNEEKQIIRERRLFDIICDNTRIEDGISRNVFLRPDFISKSSCSTSVKLKFGITCEHENFEEDQLTTSNLVGLFVGGYNGSHTLNTVELYSPKGTCQHRLPNFPIRVYNVNIQYLGLGRILACGGRSLKLGGRTECWKLNTDTFSWELLPNLSLKFPRWLSASGLHRGNWVLSGGHYSPKTSEILYISSPDMTDWRWVKGPYLKDEGRRQHCIVIINDDMYIFGGFGSGMSVAKYNFENRLWSSMNHSLLYYRYKHQCVILPTFYDVLVIGGPHGTVYNIKTGEIYLTPKSVFSHNYGSLLALGQRVFAFGGDEYSTTVEEYHLSRNQFRIVPFSLLEKRSRFGTVAVPDYFFNSLPGGCKG